MIRRIDSAADVDDLLRRRSRPFDDLRTRKFRDRKDSGGPMTGPFHDRRVVQSDERTAIFGTINVAKVVDCEDKRRGTKQGRVVARRKEQVVVSHIDERPREPPGIQRRGRM